MQTREVGTNRLLLTSSVGKHRALVSYLANFENRAINVDWQRSDERWSVEMTGAIRVL